MTAAGIVLPKTKEADKIFPGTILGEEGMRLSV